MNKTVFISSTYEDLKSHRRMVWDLLDEFEVNVRGMEQFGARTEAPLQTCIAEVEQSDIYIGIIAFRLGSIDESSGKSFTQIEYERAYELKKETLFYIMSDDAKIEARFVDTDANREKLDAFKNLLHERHTVASFVSEEDLINQLTHDFRKLLKSKSRRKRSSVDEFKVSYSMIGKFLLIPKAISGSEIRLQVQVAGNPFCASRDVCTAFNQEFGATIGIPIHIVKPGDVDKVGLNILLLPGSLADKLLPITEHDVFDIYAKLQFADSKVSDMKARLKSETVSTLPIKYFYGETPFFPDMQIKHYEADGTITLLFTRLA